MSFIEIVQAFPDETKTSLKISALVAYTLHVLLLNFSKDYKKRLSLSEQSLVAFFRLKQKRRYLQRSKYWGVLGVSLWLFYFPGIGCWRIERVHVYNEEEREKMRTLHQYMSMVEDDL